MRTFTDATARKRREAEVARAQAEYRMLFENSETGIYRVPDRRAGAHQPGAGAAARLRQRGGVARRRQSRGSSEWYVEPGRRNDFLPAAGTATGRVTDFVSEVYRHRTRERVWISETAWAIRDAAGAVVGYEGTVVDATERKRAEERIAHMARHDGLTGLPNRLLFDERLEAALREGGRWRCSASTSTASRSSTTPWGIRRATRCCGALAARARPSAVAEGQTIARLGGDEFAVLMPGAGAAPAAALAEAIVAAVREPVTLDGRPITVGASIGIALAPRDGTRPDPADEVRRPRALPGQGGRARHASGFFAPAMDAAMQARQRLELDLRDALERAEFRVLYQPVARIADGAVVGYEALLRWSHPAQRRHPARDLHRHRRGDADDRPDRRLGAGARLRRRGAPARRARGRR